MNSFIQGYFDFDSFKKARSLLNLSTAGCSVPTPFNQGFHYKCIRMEERLIKNGWATRYENRNLSIYGTLFLFLPAEWVYPMKVESTARITRPLRPLPYEMPVRDIFVSYGFPGLNENDGYYESFVGWCSYSILNMTLVWEDLRNSLTISSFVGGYPSLV